VRRKYLFSRALVIRSCETRAHCDCDGGWGHLAAVLYYISIEREVFLLLTATYTLRSLLYTAR
jgi:hypothetical protein